MIFSYRSYSIQKTKSEKWNVFNDIRAFQKSSNSISLPKKTFEKIVTNSFKMANLLKYKLSTMCCFYEKDTGSCLTEEPHQNKPNNKTPYLFKFITTVEYKN